MSEQRMIMELMLRHQDAMGRFLAEYTPLIRYIIGPILSDERDREERLSDVALQIWNRIETYDPAKSSFTTWISVVARNAALDRVRSLPPQVEELNETLAAVVGNPEDAFRQKEQRQAMRKALQTLSDGERQLFYRKYYYLQPTSQIAAELGATPRGIEGRLRRIRLKLQKRLRHLLK